MMEQTEQNLKQQGRAQSLRVRLTPQEQAEFGQYADSLLADPQVLQMEQFIQHGAVSCLEHSVAVACFSLWMCRRLRLQADLQSMVRGALLHDFFLYDWHEKQDRPGLHGFTHPKTALENAERLFQLNETERDVIVKHMWPLTLRLPKCREAVVVCVADKCCSLWETLFCRSARG